MTWKYFLIIFSFISVSGCSVTIHEKAEPIVLKVVDIKTGQFEEFYVTLGKCQPVSVRGKKFILSSECEGTK